jgi:hypothetical protein
VSFTLHFNTVVEHRPRAIVAEPRTGGGEATLREDYLSGDWYRVFPQTAKDIFFLQLLSHQADKFAPANGNGVLIAQSTLEGMQIRRG